MKLASPRFRRSREGKIQALTLFLLLAVSVAVAIAIPIGVYLFFDAKLKRTRADLQALQQMVADAEGSRELRQLEESERLAGSQRNDLLILTRAATNHLGLLLTELLEVRDLAEDLGTNEVGQGIAAQPALLTRARRVYEVNLPELVPVPVVVTRLEAVRRTERELLDTGDSLFAPSEASRTHVREASSWAEQERRSATTAQRLLRALVQESEVKILESPVPADSPTLAEAVGALSQTELAARQTTLVAREEEAKVQASVEQAKAEADRILADADARIQAMLTVAQATAQKTIDEAQLTADQMRRESEERQRLAAMDARLKQSANETAEARADQEVRRNEEETRKIALREEAMKPEVQALLAPFTAPGYWRPRGAPSVDKQPHSLTDLQGYGALDPSLSGLKNLAEVVRTARDKGRPRLKITTRFYNDPEQLEQIKEAQRLLRELGPVLVEMGLLSE